MAEPADRARVLHLVRRLAATLQQLANRCPAPDAEALGVLAEARTFLAQGGTGEWPPVHDARTDRIGETITVMLGHAVPRTQATAAAAAVNAVLEFDDLDRRLDDWVSDTATGQLGPVAAEALAHVLFVHTKGVAGRAPTSGYAQMLLGLLAEATAVYLACLAQAEPAYVAFHQLATGGRLGQLLSAAIAGNYVDAPLEQAVAGRG